MLDFRLKTFLVLSHVLNYTKTAELLYISQPAVSQHIKYLESEYNTKLFLYKDKKLSLTKNGELLYNFLINVDNKSKDIIKLLNKDSTDEIFINFGTTLTIGEYIMPTILKDLYINYPTIKVNMVVENTKSLLNKLNQGILDFVLLEGHFDKGKYNYELLSKEEFIGICSSKNILSNEEISFEDIFNERLLIREKGSGSREIFEHILYEHNYKMSAFNSKSEIGNISTIKYLVLNNLGISFLYKRAVLEEIKNNQINPISISDFNVIREFNFVYLKNNLNTEQINNFFNIFHSILYKEN